jgi:hypothetical protein
MSQNECGFTLTMVINGEKSYETQTELTELNFVQGNQPGNYVVSRMAVTCFIVIDHN